MSKIKKIVLEIGGKEIELSFKEAKELKCILSDLFAKEEIQFIPLPIALEMKKKIITKKAQLEEFLL